MKQNSDRNRAIETTELHKSNQPQPHRWLILNQHLVSRTVVAVLFAVALFSVIRTAIILPERVNRWDFSHYYLSVLVLHQGNNPYLTDFSDLASAENLESRTINRASYPPTFLFLIEPLALMPEAAAYWLWQAINLSMLIGALWLLLDGAGIVPRVAAALVACTFFYAPVAYHFFYGQAELPILFLLVLMMRLLEKQKDGWAGLCLSLSILIKIFPVILIGYLVLCRRWKALIWTCLGVFVGCAATLASLGLKTVLSYSAGVKFVTEQQWIGLTWNISINAVISRLVWLFTSDTPTASGNLVRLILSAVACLLLVGATALLTYKLAHTPAAQRALFALWLVTLVLISPTAWNHYMVLFLIFYVQFVAIAFSKGCRESCVTLAIVSVLLALPSIRWALVPIVGLIASHYGNSVAGEFVRLIGAAQFLAALACYGSANLLAAGFLTSPSEFGRHATA